jgi:hypothetical protein
MQPSFSSLVFLRDPNTLRCLDQERGYRLKARKRSQGYDMASSITKRNLDEKGNIVLRPMISLCEFLCSKFWLSRFGSIIARTFKWQLDDWSFNDCKERQAFLMCWFKMLGFFDIIPARISVKNILLSENLESSSVSCFCFGSACQWTMAHQMYDWFRQLVYRCYKQHLFVT